MDLNHVEATCQSCGNANIVWYVRSNLWNKYVREGGHPEILCPVCFAAIVGEDIAVWELRPDPACHPTAEQDACEYLNSQLGAERSECIVWKERAEKAEAEVAAVDSILARRAALDDLEHRFQTVERAINVAKQADDAKAKLAIAVEALEDAHDRVFDQGFKYVAESIANALAKIKGE